MLFSRRGDLSPRSSSFDWFPLVWVWDGVSWMVAGIETTFLVSHLGVSVGLWSTHLFCGPQIHSEVGVLFLWIKGEMVMYRSSSLSL